MAHGSIGHLGDFHPESEDWISYTERLEFYFVANGIEDPTKRRAILLSVCGSSTYQLIRDLLSPTKPTDKTFAELVALVQEHQQPAPSFIVQRYSFNTRVQQPGETINEYIAQLRKIAQHCRYGAVLEDMLRDRVVCGCRNKGLQHKLLADPTLTFDKALALAKSTETAEISAKDLPGGTVHQVRFHRRRSSQPSKSSPPLKATVQPTQPCSRCGAVHSPSTCRFKTSTCHYCKKVGHLASVCRKKARDQKSTPREGGNTRNHQLDAAVSEEPDDPAYALHYSTTKRPRPIVVSVTLSNVDTTMEVDTGATLSVMSEETYNRLWDPDIRPLLRPSSAQLTTYTGEKISVIGTINVDVSYQHQQHKLQLLIVPGTGPSLLGRDWLQHINLDWTRVNLLHSSPDKRIDEVLAKYPSVFKDDLGEIQGATATLNVDSSKPPRFYKARPVPYSLRTKVEAELTRLQDMGVISPVQFSDWAAPIVPVVKRDGKIRICGDYKLTINAISKTDSYPLPRIEDIFASLSGGKSFTKLDLAHAYQQIPLAEDSKKYTTINTHKGLFRYNRLPFGVASAPAIFQRGMESILQGLPHVCVYLDDILVTGPSDEAHIKAVDEVLRRLSEAGVRLKREKCSFMLPSVEYLGHRISSVGLQPTDEKIRALKEAPVPCNISQLKSFLGLLNYYGKFVPNLSTLLSPLHRLLQKKSTWTWGPEQQQVFDRVKSILTSDSVLAHYDPSKPLILACDASPYGVGAVLSHKLDDGSERPIAYASRSLGPAEKKYSQLDKEGLAIIFGVKRFHHYLVGRHFVILSDHKPLQHIFQSTSGVPTLASARIQRWALILGTYNYTIEYKPGPAHANADVFSRLPLPDCPQNVPIPGETILVLNMLNALPVTAAQIRQWTARDPTLSQVRLMLSSGWQHTSQSELAPYSQRQTELSLHDGCVLWGSRVVIPPPGRERILDELHEGHPGISRMKSLARSFVWWPGLDKALEQRVKDCDACQRTRNLPAAAPILPWSWPEHPWARIHVDYAGPYLGHMFLVVVDAHSKWMEVKMVKNATSTTTITALRSIFSTHGIPELLVSDNGTVFTSQEFKDFTKQNGIRHTTSAPYHPATNGLAERAVQTFKSFLKKSPDGSLEDRLSKFLFSYRITPHSTTGNSPAELLFGRRPRSILDLVRPNLAQHVQTRQQQQKLHRDRNAKSRVFSVDDPVFVCNLPSKKDWLPGTIVRTTGPLSFEIALADGRTVRRHYDHIRSRDIRTPSSTNDWTDIPDIPVPVLDPSPPSGPPTPSPPPPRRSGRISVRPDRLVDHLLLS